MGGGGAEETAQLIRKLPLCSRNLNSPGPEFYLPAKALTEVPVALQTRGLLNSQAALRTGSSKPRPALPGAGALLVSVEKWFGRPQDGGERCEKRVGPGRRSWPEARPAQSLIPQEGYRLCSCEAPSPSHHHYAPAQPWASPIVGAPCLPDAPMVHWTEWKECGPVHKDKPLLTAAGLPDNAYGVSF